MQLIAIEKKEKHFGNDYFWVVEMWIYLKIGHLFQLNKNRNKHNLGTLLTHSFVFLRSLIWNGENNLKRTNKNPHMDFKCCYYFILGFTYSALHFFSFSFFFWLYSKTWISVGKFPQRNNINVVNSNLSNKPHHWKI